MSSQYEPLIQQAIADARAGNKPAARVALSKVVRKDSGNARAWYLLSQVVDSQEQAVYCLNQVLRIQPDNAQAKERLQRFASVETTEPSITADTSEGLPPVGASKSKPSRLLKWVIGIIASCLVCSCGLIGLAALPSLFNSSTTPIPNELQASPVAILSTLEPIPTSDTALIPTDIILPTLTSLPILTDTPLPSLTPIPTGLAFMGIGDPPSCIPPNAPFEIGIATHVVDGDTIDVLINGKTFTVRYIGMDTPETKDPGEPIQFYGPEAEAKNREMVEGKTIVLVKDVSEVDRYDRLLRYVFVKNLSGIFVNYELVKQGFAQAVSYPPDTACDSYFRQAQQSAQLAVIGIWGATPIPSITPIQPPSRSGGAPCNCSGPDLDCTANFSTQAQAQACFEYCKSLGFGDVFRLDGNNDGRACETLP